MTTTPLPFFLAPATPDPGQVCWSASVLWFVRGPLIQGPFGPGRAMICVGPPPPANRLSWN